MSTTSILRDKDISPIVRKSFLSHSQTIRYQPEGYLKTGKKKLALEVIESWIKSNYILNYSIYKDLDLHTNALYHFPTEEFGVTSKVKSEKDFFKLLPNYRYYGSLFYQFRLFQRIEVYLSKLRSNIVKVRLHEDSKLRFTFAKAIVESSLERFFLRGSIKKDWITVDKLVKFGFDKFPYILNSRLEYFRENLDRTYLMDTVGEYHLNGTKLPKSFYTDRKKIIRNLIDQLKKKKKNEISYIDYLEYEEKTRPYFIKGDIFSFWGNFNKIPYVKLLGNPIRTKSNCDLNEYLAPCHLFFHENLEPNDYILDKRILQKYLETYNVPENTIRGILGLPKIGEGWISETNLYYEIRSFFINEIVVQHARPKWLKRQHFDIFLPNRNLAIEYQGDQHQGPVEYFGGEEAFRKNKERDLKKRKLAEENNCFIIYVYPGYDLSNVIDEVSEKLKITH
jgi:hypothetical protein